MPGPDCAAGGCLPGAEPVWLLVGILVVWAVVAVVFVALGVVCWRERRQERTTRHPAHSVARPDVVSAVTVEEIARRLQAERTHPPRTPRKVTVIGRSASLAPRRALFDPISQADDEDSGRDER